MKTKLLGAVLVLTVLAVMSLGVYWLLRARTPPQPSRGTEPAIAWPEGPDPTRPEVGQAPALKLAAELPWEDVYAGDQLRVRVRLSSPRAMHEVRQTARMREQGRQVTAPTFAPPPISLATWIARVRFDLYKVNARGSREAVLQHAAWQTLGSEERKGLPEIRLGIVALVKEWMVPPDLATQLGEGQYVLEVAWLGKDNVDGPLVDPDGKLRAASLTFTIKTPANDVERAAHAERLAYFEHLHGRHQEARSHGLEALRLDRQGFPPQRVETYLVIAEASLALGDRKAAADAYRALLRNLPPPQHNSLALAVSQRLKALAEWE